MGDEENVVLSDNCKECVTGEFKELSKSVISFSDSIIKSLIAENRILILILGVIS